MTQKTPLYSWHVAQGARMVPFAGWELPLHYGSQLAEHQRVREDGGLFDVSHMLIADVRGPDARALLRRCLANDVERLDRAGGALYGAMLNREGGIIDDLIVYRRGENDYRLVLNAAMAADDCDWLRRQALAAGWRVDLLPRHDLAMLAVQGPAARARVTEVLGIPALLDLPRFHFLEAPGGFFIARTGYTGEDGCEIMLPADQAVDVAERLRATGMAPCGLGARDTLRLEAGLNLNGQDMDPSTTPDESNLDWTVDLRDPSRDFVGRSAIERQRRDGVRRRLWGVVLEDGIPRHGQTAEDSDGTAVGVVTSGAFGPSLKRGIGLARISGERRAGDEVWILIRGQRKRAWLVRPPFWRAGGQTFAIHDESRRKA